MSKNLIRQPTTKISTNVVYDKGLRTRYILILVGISMCFLLFISCPLLIFTQINYVGQIGAASTANQLVNPAGTQTPPSTRILKPKLSSLTPLFTKVPSPQFTSTSLIANVEGFVRDYFYLVTHDRNYEYTWSLLTVQFRNANSPDGYSDYVRFWDSVDELEITSLEVFEHNAKSANCRIDMVFYINKQYVPVKVSYHLIYDDNRQSWLFENP